MKILSFLFSFIFLVPAFAVEDNVVLLSPPKALPSFELKDVKNEKFDQHQLQAHWSLLFFGFTRCQVICPNTMTILKNAYEIMEKNKKTVPQIIFISVDGVHDTPQTTDRYAKSFNTHFMGLAGGEKQIQLLTKSLGVLYMKVKQNEEETIDHSINLFLVNPQGQVAAIFSAPYESSMLAREIEKIIKTQ